MAAKNGKNSGLGPIIKDSHLVKDRPQHRAEILVRRMRQVGVAVRFVLEGQQEEMGLSLVQVLRAHIGAPFQILEHARGAGQAAESGLDGAHLFRRGVIFELEHYHVAEYLRRLIVIVSNGIGCNCAEEKAKSQKTNGKGYK